jgi:hypothetical protein
VTGVEIEVFTRIPCVMHHHKITVYIALDARLTLAVTAKSVRAQIINRHHMHDVIRGLRDLPAISHSSSMDGGSGPTTGPNDDKINLPWSVAFTVASGPRSFSSVAAAARSWPSSWSSSVSCPMTGPVGRPVCGVPWRDPSSPVRSPETTGAVFFSLPYIAIA